MVQRITLAEAATEILGVDAPRPIETVQEFISTLNRYFYEVDVCAGYVPREGLNVFIHQATCTVTRQPDESGTADYSLILERLELPHGYPDFF